MINLCMALTAKSININKVLILSRKPLNKSTGMRRVWKPRTPFAGLIPSLVLIKSDLIKLDLFKRTFWKF